MSLFLTEKKRFSNVYFLVYLLHVNFDKYLVQQHNTVSSLRVTHGSFSIIFPRGKELI